MTDQTYPGILLGTTTETRFVPYANQGVTYIRMGRDAYTDYDMAADQCAFSYGDIVVSETVTITREVVRQIPPVDYKRERADEWASEGERDPREVER